MNRLVGTNQKTNAIIIGWCSFQKGGRISNVRPDGYESGGSGDGWNEEQWCSHIVETALGAYGEAYGKLKPEYARRAAGQMRDWLREIFWDSVDMSVYGSAEPMVVREVSGFRRLVESEAQKNPRLKTFEVV